MDLIPQPQPQRVKPKEVIIVGLLFAAFAVFMINWGLEGVIHSRQTHSVPDLKGRSIAAAMDVLAPLNLGLRKAGSEFDSSVPIASVLRQEPSPGTVVREGKI